MSRGEMKPEFPGEGAVHANFSRVLSQERFWIHTRKTKIGSECVFITHQKKSVKWKSSVSLEP